MPSGERIELQRSYLLKLATKAGLFYQHKDGTYIVPVGPFPRDEIKSISRGGDAEDIAIIKQVVTSLAALAKSRGRHCPNCDDGVDDGERCEICKGWGVTADQMADAVALEGVL